MIKKFSNLISVKSWYSRAKRSGGFSMLESIVAIFILSLSISGAFSAVVQGLSQTTIAKDEIRAFYLAQEAVEIIRNKRDSNQLATIKGTPTNWLDGITTACPFNKTCSVEVTNINNIVDCGSGWGSCSQNLKQDQSNYLYSQTYGNDTNFKREIQLELVNSDVSGNPTEISVTVRITWKKGIFDREFKVKTLLFNWM